VNLFGGGFASYQACNKNPNRLLLDCNKVAVSLWSGRCQFICRRIVDRGSWSGLIKVTALCRPIIEYSQVNKETKFQDDQCKMELTGKSTEFYSYV
jgi:hypothetical protein